MNEMTKAAGSTPAEADLPLANWEDGWPLLDAFGQMVGDARPPRARRHIPRMDQRWREQIDRHTVWTCDHQILRFRKSTATRRIWRKPVGVEPTHGAKSVQRV